MTKASDNEFPSVLLAEQGSAPTTPATGNWRLYTKSDGLYIVDDAGNSTGPFGEGSGGLTQAYVGYNTAGGSWEGMTNLRVYATKITLANNCLVTSIAAYLKNASSGTDDIVHTLHTGLYTDNSGTPQYLIHELLSGDNTTPSMIFDSASGSTGDDTARWFEHPCGVWLTAGDYWIAVQMVHTTTPNLAIAYDGSGSDRYYTSGGGWMSDWGFYSPTTGSNKYSIRANTVR